MPQDIKDRISPIALEKTPRSALLSLRGSEATFLVASKRSILSEACLDGKLALVKPNSVCKCRRCRHKENAPGVSFDDVGKGYEPIPKCAPSVSTISP